MPDWLRHRQQLQYAATRHAESPTLTQNGVMELHHANTTAASLMCLAQAMVILVARELLAMVLLVAEEMLAIQVSSESPGRLCAS